MKAIKQNHEKSKESLPPYLDFSLGILKYKVEVLLTTLIKTGWDGLGP
jgi:hypothetical protein